MQANAAVSGRLLLCLSAFFSCPGDSVDDGAERPRDADSRLGQERGSSGCAEQCLVSDGRPTLFLTALEIP